MDSGTFSGVQFTTQDVREIIFVIRDYGGESGKLHQIMDDYKSTASSIINDAEGNIITEMEETGSNLYSGLGWLAVCLDELANAMEKYLENMLNDDNNFASALRNRIL